MHAWILQAAAGASEGAAELPTGYGVALLQTLLALAAVCILAWVVLRWAAQRGLGIAGNGQHVRVIERVPLDARRTLWLVRVGGRVFLIGAGDGASPGLLAELSEKDLADPAHPSRAVKAASFLDVLRRTTRSGEEDPRVVEARAEDARRASEE